MKNAVSVILILCLLVSTVSFTALAAGGTTVFIKAEDFTELGTWTLTEPGSGSALKILRAPDGSLGKSALKPAQVTIDLPADGEYTVWARGRDFSNDPGRRVCQVRVDGTLFDKLVGTHGGDGFAWEKVGSIRLKKGEVLVELVDTAGFWARVEGVVLTSDASFKLPETAEAITDAAKTYAPKISANSAKPAETPAPQEIPPLPEGSLFPIDYYGQGADTSIRFVVALDKIPMTVTENSLEGYAVKGTFTEKETGKVIPFDSVILGNEMRDTATVIRVAPTKEVPASNYDNDKRQTHAINLAVYPKEMVTKPTTAPTAAPAPTKEPEQSPAPEKPVLVPTMPADPRPDVDIAVALNGKYLAFDVDPIIRNDRTLVPLRGIFEALGADVAWNPDNETATGTKNGLRVSATIGNNTAMVGRTPVTIDQPPIIYQDRTMVPLRFISESYECVVDWDDATRTVLIAAPEKQAMYYISATSFNTYGTWNLMNTYLQGRSTAGTADAATGEDGGEDATVTIDIDLPGQYKIWARARDYESNQPGTRTFHLAVDGKRLDKKLGTHGKQGFVWEEVATLELSEGAHTIALQDTSGFYARCEGIFVSSDMDFVPPDDLEALAKMYPPVDKFANLPSAFFPAWANEPFEDVKSETIENDKVKIVFHQGMSRRGPVVQNELFIKDGGEWVQVKAKNEELGFLMIKATRSAMVGKGTGSGSAPVEELTTKVDQTITVDGEEITSTVDSFYTMGEPIWFIPTDFVKTEDGKIVLSFNNAAADLSVTYGFDDVSYDPKVTLDAAFKEDAAYSFLLSGGTEYDDDAFERVTAPMLFVKRMVPAYDVMYQEAYMFTPMATFTLPAGSKVPGKKLTTGIAIDPTSVPQDFAYPKTSRFGLVLRTPTNKLRGQFAAPMFGSDYCNFKAGDTFSISYRILNDALDWFDAYKHVSQDLYKLADLRTNYYTSINEAIYNATDLAMDDFYGGWDPKNMSWYNMEAQEVSSHSNLLEMMQRYLLTENPDILERRVIPTLAFSLSRNKAHFKRTPGSVSYATDAPTKLNDNGSVGTYGTSVYGGIYEMSQGRMPYFLNQAVMNAGASSDVTGITAQAAMYRYTGDESYKQGVKNAADKLIANTVESEKYLTSSFSSPFVFGDYSPTVTAFLAAYEATGDQKYLDAAQEAGKLLSTSLWTTGYQNDYATTFYTIDPVKTAERRMTVDNSKPSWWWHGTYQWRLGNEIGDVDAPMDHPDQALKEETVPGWLPTKTGLGTEHPGTASHGNYVLMNTWAGMFEKLSAYTGDPFFTMQARNATVGRFGNYAGYYQDRYVTHIQTANYPYVGPDYSLIYWHHIPVFIAQLEDYLINSVWARTNRNVEFPSVYQSGYAYFVSNQYGYASGKFFDEDGMWLWLDRGIVEPSSIQIDYIAAKKDGKLGIAMVNEEARDLPVTMTLGAKVPGGSTYSGTAVAYAADGSKSDVTVENGRFTVTVPAKGSLSVLLSIDGIKKPVYVNDNFVYANDPKETISMHKRGRGYVLQVAPDSYYAYVYVTDLAEDTKKLTVNYTAGSKKGTEEITEYPFEAIIKVDNAGDAFTYTLTATKQDGSTEDLGGGTLKAMPNGAEKQDVKRGGYVLSSITERFTPFSPKALGIGIGDTMRFVVETKDFPFEVTEDGLTGLPVKIALISKADGSVLILDSIIVGNEMRPTSTVLKVNGTDAVPKANFSDTHTAEVLIFNPGDDTSSIKLPSEK